MKSRGSDPSPPLRFVTAASLFDGHDAAINIMRRILQSSGVEVIHLGHNRSVQDIVNAAIQEDAHAIAISSYQGGHNEFFRYCVDLLKEGSAPITVFGGGGGTITPNERAELEKYGVCRLYSPEDGRTMGLQGIIDDMLARCRKRRTKPTDFGSLSRFDSNWRALAQTITWIETGFDTESAFWKTVIQQPSSGTVIGVTGTGGAGKSSLTDEIVLRLLENEPHSRIAILAIDPTRRKTGGALLGDRLRVNSLQNPRVFMRSLATRQTDSSVSQSTWDVVEVLKRGKFDWIFVETGGIGQADATIAGQVDLSLYVMTSEFGAPTQLEKINMLDYADLIVINKFDKKGSLDALADVRRQFRRNHREFEKVTPTRYPVIGTIASRFGDPGVDIAFRHLQSLRQTRQRLQALGEDYEPTEASVFIPHNRVSYLSEVSSLVRNYHLFVDQQVKAVGCVEALKVAADAVDSSLAKEELALVSEKTGQIIAPETHAALALFDKHREQYAHTEVHFTVRDKTVSVTQKKETLSHTLIPRVSLPRYCSRADLTRFLLTENLPGYFPFTGGVFPFKREEEDPKRQFAGEGTPSRTNKRFHLLCQNEKAKRLSTAFDSVTLYGEDPNHRPDIFGKVGESGVSVCTLDDAKVLYSGFDLCDPSTSVSMTINGPAPMLLAFFFNTAIDQQLEKFQKAKGRAPTPPEAAEIRAFTLKTVRGTVQADILKEDQAQNTCIFSTEFALKMMGDMQQYFIDHEIRNYYSVSISGYHIAEAGANPISQTAFTLANGFTFVEYYRARGMNIDDFVPNFSFFFSNGLDAEYTVIGRVARRIWSIAMKNGYKAGERSQKLKYHIQTSGRSLHAQEISFNDIRTTLQALLAYFDHCNSLHTNAYDEAVTTPTEESVRRAMAIQLVITKEFGWAKNENPLQGSFIVEELTSLVEEAVLTEFDRLSQRGGVLGAMETHYQRTQIQEESLYYEELKHSGELPIIGVNTYLNPHRAFEAIADDKLTRASYQEKEEQINHLNAFHKSRASQSAAALQALKKVVLEHKNIFAELMETVRSCSLGQISHALYELGGRYRRGV
ncbi:MAG: methylmalonyl-CoA mutase family protein [Deltaproteobacteria bacterium]|nr:methylmalonyl-CoA mutase family protein [Deltaproteobacteria bacterium]MBI3296350.1 methylmalonyl-CoA mutase family protein [Deltaproteobacteria bacterium]